MTTDDVTTQQLTQLLAQVDETTHQLEQANARCVALNVEVRLRDQRIAELEAELQQHTADTTPTPEGAPRG